MNITTERIENHRARLIVEVETERWEKAKKQAARKLSRRYSIPGFRKGKAPYSVIQRYIGESPIIEDAMENLGNEVYKNALDESEIDPYTAGSLEDFQLEPQPTYTFTVPLVPEVELNDYQSVRVEYEPAEVTDDDLNQAMRQLQQREALVEESHSPVEVGDRVTVDIHSEFVDGEDLPEDEENVDEETAYKGDNFIHRHDIELDLDPETEPILPGFIEALVGAEVDEEREFELVIPDDDDEYEDIAGRTVKFHVTVNEIKKVTLPELNDDFAARLTSEEDEPLTLLQLRMRVRENMQNEADEQVRSEYTDKVLEAMVEEADLSYPREMVEDRIEDMLEDLNRQLQQQGMTLETYQKVTGISKEDLYEQYYPQAEKSVQKTLVLREVLAQQDVQVRDEDVDAQMEQMLSQFGDQAEEFRQFLDTPQQRESMVNNLLYGKVLERIERIGRGLPLDEAEETADETAGDAPVDAADEEPVAVAATEEPASDETDDNETVDNHEKSEE